MSDIRKRKWDEPAEGASKSVKTEGSGSPAGDVKPSSDAKDALDAAAEIAARIAAQYAKPVVPDVPYVAGARELNDPEFVKDIEINDIRNRYVLTKGPTQQQILADTGASVTTKGVWYPDKSMYTDKDPPLYLHITAESAEKLEAGIKAVEALIAQELGPLLDQNRFRDRDAPRERRKWPEEKIFIEFEALRNFNIRAKVVGPGGLFVKYIQQETQTRVQIKGLGSGFVETDTGRESEDPMHVHVTGPDQPMVDKATEMAKDLLVVVQEEHAKAKAVLEQGFQQQQQGGYGQQQQQGYGGAGYNYGQQQQQQQYPGYQAYAGGVTAPLPTGEAPPPPPSDGSQPPPPPSNAPPAAPSAVPAQQAGGTATPEEWAAYWNSLDPASQAYYTQYYAAAYAQPGAAVAGAGSPATAAPYSQPQQSAPKGGSGAYGAVPPPAGM
ncbi:hypothetical protein P7C70_g2880, partial [Phenoliferia sp. Uapishka_3]